MKKRIAFAAFFFCILVNHLLAQETLNVDSLYNVAKKYAETRDYANAEKACSDILIKRDNDDVRFYLGLVYSWDKKYEDARRELNKVYKSRPGNKEVILALANNELWSGNPQTALDILNKALQNSPDNEEYLFLKAKALKDLKRYDEAVAVLQKLTGINPHHCEAKSLLASVISAKIKNGVMVDFSADYFDHQNPWYLGYVQYLRKEKIGSFIARLNYAERYHLNDYQLEADAYLNTGSSNHLYLNAGISGAKLFPDYRFGAEFFQTLPKRFEVSLGFRYLKFTYSDVDIFTGSISKYFGQYWLSFRPYVIPVGNEVFHTEVYQARRYFCDPETYVGLQYTHGTSPDDIHMSFLGTERLQLLSDEIKLICNKRIALYWIGTIRLAYAREEYMQFENRYSFEFSLQKLF
jgi:YaiO family outer membrane protein